MDIYQKTTEFYLRFEGEKRIIGNSLFGRNIYAVKIGNGAPIGIAQYAIHGREFITAELAFAHAQEGLYKGSFWLIPLVNPDGALLSEIGLQSVENEVDRKKLKDLYGVDFSLWKANGRGVDLNVNFPANWGKGEKNTRTAGAENYIGQSPCSESETLALRAFTREISPNYTVSYHTKGEEIYWYFYQPISRCAKDKALALALSRSTGYRLAHAKGSAGGYKDWCIQALKIPSFTIEAGAEELLHPIRSAKGLIKKNKRALFDLSKEYCLHYEKIDAR